MNRKFMWAIFYDAGSRIHLTVESRPDSRAQSHCLRSHRSCDALRFNCIWLWTFRRFARQNCRMTQLLKKFFRTILLSVFLLVLPAIDAAAADPVEHLELVKLTDHIYLVKDGFYYPENSVVYIGDNDVTVISATWTPATAQLLTDKIRAITGKPITGVVNTHFHLDRVGGNPHFKKNWRKDHRFNDDGKFNEEKLGVTA